MNGNILLDANNKVGDSTELSGGLSPPAIKRRGLSPPGSYATGYGLFTVHIVELTVYGICCVC